MTVRLEELLAAATPGPWLRGDVWSLGGVMPERYGDGKCVHCVNVGTEPVWVGRRDINGTVMLAHRHLVLDPYDTQHAISGADGTLVCGNYDYESGGVVREEDAALVALAPDAVRLLIDMGKAFRRHQAMGYAPGEDVQMRRELEDLLARLDRLGNTT